MRPAGLSQLEKLPSEVLIRHLLTHTSGLAYGFSNAMVAPLQQKTGKSAEELPLLYDPGNEVDIFRKHQGARSGG